MVPAGEDGIRLALRGALHEIGPVHLVRPPNVFAALDGLAVAFSRSCVGRKKIIPFPMLKDMRPFKENLIRFINILNRSGHFLLYRVVFLQNQPSGIFLRNTVVGCHTDHVFSAVPVVEKRGVKTKVI